MGVTVVTTTTASSAEFVRLRAAVSVADSPQATTSYALPAAQIAYVDLTLNVVVDTLGRYKILSDVVGVSDVRASTVSKPFAHGVGASDFSTLEPRKGLADSVGLSDELTRTLVFLRNFANSAAAADAHAVTFTPEIKREFLLMESQQVFDIAKLIAEGVAMNDSSDVGDGSTYAFTKGISNMAFVGDASARTAVKNFTDAATTADATTQQVAKGLADTTGALDVVARAVTKSLANSFSVLDAPAIAFARPLTDVFSLGDNKFWSFSASRVESVTVPDSGFLRSQNYCDPTYFAEDYVGVSQSF